MSRMGNIFQEHRRTRRVPREFISCPEGQQNKIGNQKMFFHAAKCGIAWSHCRKMLSARRWSKSKKGEGCRTTNHTQEIQTIC